MDKEQILAIVEKATAPPMPKAQALQVLEDVHDGLQMRIDALREELPTTNKNMD